MKTSNILDPIHDTLDPRLFDNPGDPEPKLKPQHRKWIVSNIHNTLEDHGYENVEDWLSLVLTGSLTTYQYSDDSDVDVSLFVNAERFPEWSRAEMIGVMIDNMDGVTLPGTPFPMQCFVVPPGVKRSDIYKPGLRSGYEIEDDTWIVPPDPDRVIDVEQEMNAVYVYALQSADKMERLLRYEPDKAIQYWHQIHDRRRRDMKAGKGDYSPSNIVYKFLANRDLFPKIEELTGEYIARTAAAPVMYHVAPRWAREEIKQHGLRWEEGHSQYPGDVEGGGNPQAAVYLWEYPDYAEEWVRRSEEEDLELGVEEDEPGYDIYEVNTEGLNLQPDRVSEASWASLDPIGPERIRLVDLGRA